MYYTQMDKTFLTRDFLLQTATTIVPLFLWGIYTIKAAVHKFSRTSCLVRFNVCISSLPCKDTSTIPFHISRSANFDGCAFLWPLVNWFNLSVGNWLAPGFARYLSSFHQRLSLMGQSLGDRRNFFLARPLNCLPIVIWSIFKDI